MSIPAIPTVYRGVLFRSRLEAKWACLLDELGIRWTYEPSERQGWIPDFQIGDALLDVKPWTTFDDAFTHKLERAGEPEVSFVLAESPTWPRWTESMRHVGWDAYGVPLMLGHYRSSGWGFKRMWRDESGRLVAGRANGFDDLPRRPASDLNPNGGMVIDRAWRAAGNATQWRPAAPPPVHRARPRATSPHMPPTDDEDLFL